MTSVLTERLRVFLAHGRDVNVDVGLPVRRAELTQLPLAYADLGDEGTSFARSSLQTRVCQERPRLVTRLFARAVRTPAKPRDGREAL